jgi:hypothetical protein
MQNTQITSIDQLGGYYKKHSSRVKKSIENINNKIKEKTKDEKKILDDAIEKYQNKINEVLQEKEIIEENKNIEISTNKMKKAIGLASKKFFTKRERIFNDTGLSSKEKKEEELKLYNQMLDSFFNEDEKEFFQNIIKQNMIIVSNPKDLKSSKVMKLLQ